MVHLLTTAVAGLAATCLFGSVSALNPITINGSKFFDAATGDQFFIKGVAYQPRSHTTGFSDPLSKPDDCKRDASLMKSLGLNTIRVYQVDPSLNHDECMATFESAGIYLILDLTVPKHSIVRNNPEYDINIWNQVRDTIDTFKGYRNILGFFAGNEVTNDKSTTVASAYVKALLRDIKTHINSTSSRKIPVGYANNDDPDVRLQIQAYFNCGKEEERADFYGINLYEWCGTDVDYQTSGYADRTKEVAIYSVPVFLSEFGCNTVSPRTFTEVHAIYGPNMTNIWSGGIVYEWSEEDNHYGLVKINPDKTAKPLVDYDYLQKALTSVHPKGVRMDAFKEERPISTCPANTDMWEPNARLPPTPSGGACECMMSSLNCVASDQAIATTENLGSLLNTICGMTSCDDITSNGKTGVYGKYSFCTPAQKLSYMYNFYHVNMGKKQPGSCSFNGMAKLTTASKSSDKECMTIKDPLIGPKTGSSSAGWAMAHNLVLVELTALVAFMLNH